MESKAVWTRRALVGAGIGWLAARSALAQATFNAGRKDGNVVVVVFLRGGSDGLHTVSPYFEDW